MADRPALLAHHGGGGCVLLLAVLHQAGMSDRIQVEIPVAPRVKGRPRTIITKEGKPRTLTPKGTREYEAVVKQWMAALRGRGPISGPVAVHIELYKDRSVMIVESVSAEPRKLRGDIDNYGKSLIDAGNGILYEDDRQIVSLTIVEKGTAPYEMG